MRDEVVVRHSLQLADAAVKLLIFLLQINVHRLFDILLLIREVIVTQVHTLCTAAFVSPPPQCS